jgi:hypothetical protein
VSHNLTTNEFFKWRTLRKETSIHGTGRSSITHYYDLGSFGKNIKEVFNPRYERKLDILVVKLQQQNKKQTTKTQEKEEAEETKKRLKIM